MCEVCWVPPPPPRPRHGIIGQCERNTVVDLSKLFSRPIQVKALPNVGFNGKMSPVDLPSVLFSHYLPLTTFKGLILFLGKFLPQEKEEKALSRETFLDLENLRSSRFGKMFFGAPILIQSALEGTGSRPLNEGECGYSNPSSVS